MQNGFGKIGRAVVLMAAVGVGLGAFGADIAFIGADGSGSGDLANKEHWNGGALPGTTASVVFSKAGEVTASSPMSLGQVTINANPVVFRETGDLAVNGDWLMTNNKLGCMVTTGSVITATGRMKLAWTANVCGSRLDVVGEGAKLEMKSATQSLFGAQDGCCDNVMHVADGGVLKLNALWCSPNAAVAKQTNNTIIVESGGAFSAGGVSFAGGKDSTSVCGHHHVKVLSGGSMTLSGDLTLGAAYAPESEAVVDGADSLAKVGTFTLGAASGGNTLTVANGGEFKQAVETSNPVIGSGAGASNNVLSVYSDGGFDAIGNLILGSSGAHNRILVDSAKYFYASNYIAKAGVAKYLYIGEKAEACGNALVVSNTPATYVRALTVGVSGSDNLCEFHNAARMPFGSATIGKNAGADNNTLIVHGTGTWDVASLGYSFGSGTGSRIRYEGFSVGGNGLGNPGISVPSGDRLEFGTGLGLLTYGTVQLSGTASSQLLLDGATWKHVQGLGNNARTYINPNVCLVLDNGAKMAFTNGWAFTVGNSTDTCAISGDVIEVRNGSEMCVSDMRVSHSKNLFVVSNATLFVNTSLTFPETRSIYQPAYGTHGFCTNNTIRLEGATPRFVTKGTAMSFDYVKDADDGLVHVGDNRLVFNVPAEGYSQPPLEALPSDGGVNYNISFGRSTRIFADVSAYRPATRTSIPLARASGTISVTDMEELGSELPPGCRLKLSADKKLLSLSVGGCGGLMLLVR